MAPVETDPSFESVSFVTMPYIVHAPDTLGAALDAFEIRVERAGIHLNRPNGFDDGTIEDGSSPAGNTSDPILSMVFSKLHRCSQLIDLAITQAIIVGQASSTTAVGKDVTPENLRSTLVAGNIVLLGISSSQCLRMTDTAVFYDSITFVADVNIARKETLFLVVSGGKDRVALFSPVYWRFLRCDKGGNLQSSASGPQAVRPNDRPRVDEIFEVDHLDGNNPRLYNRFLDATGIIVHVRQVVGLDF